MITTAGIIKYWDLENEGTKSMSNSMEKINCTVTKAGCNFRKLKEKLPQ